MGALLQQRHCRSRGNAPCFAATLLQHTLVSFAQHSTASQRNMRSSVGYIDVIGVNVLFIAGRVFLTAFGELEASAASAALSAASLRRLKRHCGIVGGINGGIVASYSLSYSVSQRLARQKHLIHIYRPPNKLRIRWNVAIARGVGGIHDFYAKNCRKKRIEHFWHIFHIAIQSCINQRFCFTCSDRDTGLKRGVIERLKGLELVCD